MQRYFLSFAALSGFIAVALGAFAAHGLKRTLAPYSLDVFHTATQYQMIHALVLLIVGLLISKAPQSKLLTVAGLAFILGSLLFSGSLYAIALGAPSGLGIITPLGGLSFLVGWAALAVFATRS